MNLGFSIFFYVFCFSRCNGLIIWSKYLWAKPYELLWILCNGQNLIKPNEIDRFILYCGQGWPLLAMSNASHICTNSSKLNLVSLNLHLTNFRLQTGVCQSLKIWGRGACRKAVRRRCRRRLLICQHPPLWHMPVAMKICIAQDFSAFLINIWVYALFPVAMHIWFAQDFSVFLINIWVYALFPVAMHIWFALPQEIVHKFKWW